MPNGKQFSFETVCSPFPKALTNIVKPSSKL